MMENGKKNSIASLGARKSACQHALVPQLRKLRKHSNVVSVQANLNPGINLAERCRKAIRMPPRWPGDDAMNAAPMHLLRERVPVWHLGEVSQPEINLTTKITCPTPTGPNVWECWAAHTKKSCANLCCNRLKLICKGKTCRFPHYILLPLQMTASTNLDFNNYRFWDALSIWLVHSFSRWWLDQSPAHGVPTEPATRPCDERWRTSSSPWLFTWSRWAQSIAVLEVVWFPWFPWFPVSKPGGMIFTCDTRGS